MDQTKVGDAPHLARFCPQAANGPHFMSMWSSPEAFSRHLQALDPSQKWKDSGRENGQEDQYGTSTFQEALDIADKGWKDGVEKVYKLRDLINAINPVRRQPVEFGIAGIIPSIPRAVAGNPMNMRKPNDALNKRKPVITLVTNMTAAWFVNKDSITNRAAVMASIIDRIEAAGFGCEVVSTALTQGRGDFHATTMVVVKEAGQPVDVGRLAYGIGHVSMFRRLIFADWAGNKACEKNLGYGLGRCIEPQIGELPMENIYVLPSAGKNHEMFEDDEKSSKEGLNFIIDCLKKQGCPAFTKEKVHADELAKQDMETEEDHDDDW